MFVRSLLATAALIGLLASPVLAQTTAPARTGGPAAPAPAAPTAGSAATAAAPAAPAATKTNLNTATASQLDSLPGVGTARGKAILDERAKGKFKDWADFDKRMAGTSVNAGVKAKIAPLVTF